MVSMQCVLAWSSLKIVSHSSASSKQTTRCLITRLYMVVFCVDRVYKDWSEVYRLVTTPWDLQIHLNHVALWIASVLLSFAFSLGISFLCFLYNSSVQCFLTSIWSFSSKKGYPKVSRLYTSVVNFIEMKQVSQVKAEVVKETNKRTSAVKTFQAYLKIAHQE